jgi:lysophospholipase L1-like esterase
LKIRWFDAERALSALAAGLSLLVILTCSGAELARPVEAPPAHPAGEARPPSDAPVLNAAGSVGAPASAALGAAPPASSMVEAPSAAVPIAAPRFYATLRELELGRRTSHVRVVWFGDSHTAADFMSQPVRDGLKRFPSGGPGHVLLGMRPYRHGLVRSEAIGSFRIEPSAPASSQRQGDGVFGLAGVRAVPEAWEARLVLTPNARAIRASARWELVYRLPAGASFRFRIGNAVPVEVNAKTSAKPAKPGLLPRIVREAEAGAALEITAGYGSPQLFGAIVESREPGLVIDTLGINGARASTPLGWDEKTFDAELAARAPELFVLAYGTNEAFDTRSAERAVEPLRRLVERLRRSAPGADCLILGPPDVAESGGGSHPRIAGIEAEQRRAAGELGCAFFSLRAVMGGDGSFARWAKEKPQLAGFDKVHLTPAGYAKLGDALARALLDSYTATSAR